jgi:Ca2+-binding EF-hand superfamily protein
MRTWILAGTYLSAGALALWLATSAAAQDLPPEVAKKVAELDRNGDGKLQQSEVPFPAEVFKRGDLDKDGSLTHAEAYRLYLIEEAKKKVRKPGKYERRFKKADKDKDGKVSSEEFPGPATLFTRMDRDGNGGISPDEAMRFSIEEELAEICAKFDKDLSGTLSMAEMPKQAKGIFFAADKNGDGELSGEEAFEFIYEVRRDAAKGAAAGGDKSAGKTRAKTGASDKLGVLKVLLTQFAALDTDKDGKLKPEELGATADLFARLDADGDGAVDRAEIDLRKGFAQRLGERGKALKKRIEQSKLQLPVAVLAKELEGMFMAGRYEETAKLMDHVELRIARYEARKTKTKGK